MVELFGRLAPVFDQVGVRYFSAFGERLVEFAGVGPGDAVLDVACGRGAVSRAALERVGPRGRVVAVDAAEEMVAAARRDFAGERVEFRRGVAEALELPEASFDRVLCGFALFLFREPERALLEMLRVARPGGTVAVSTVAPERDRRWWWLVGLKHRRLGAEAVRPAFSAPETLVRALSAAGLVDVVVEPVDLDTSYADAEEWLRTLTSSGESALVAEMTPAERAAFERQALPHLEHAREEDGRIHQVRTAWFARGSKAS